MTTIKRRDYSRAQKPRFITRREHTDGNHNPPWVVIDLRSDAPAEGTAPEGYTNAAEALAAQRACIAEHGAFL